MDWKPIETAPKDKGSLLLFAPPDLFAVAKWYFGDWGTGGPPVMGDALYHIEWTHWSPLLPPTK